jgi:filamentous hemagglutinin family protein
MHKNLSGVAFPLLGSLTVSGILIFSHNQVLAQVTPDNTLGDESSVVNTRDATNESIDGGAIRGQNLFHSFEEFNVDAGRGVYFANPEAINNIFSRVTGNNVSNILGTLGVDGAANLFLINPNGIVFGEGASLDVQGSFAATTADGIEFGEQGFFGVSNPESPKLLTINPSAYLFNQVAPGAIANNSRVTINNIPVGLIVDAGKSLSLVGGDINLNGGIVNALGGKVDLGGLAAAGTIGINNDGSLSFPNNVARADVFLSKGAFVNVSAIGGGAININANDLKLTEESKLQSGIDIFDISGVGNPKAVAGDITMGASQWCE